MRLSLGIDLGTHGARAVVLNEHGRVVASGDHPLETICLPGIPTGWYEQDPEDWWRAVTSAVQAAAGRCDPSLIRTVCVTSTSGTVLPIERSGRPRRSAIMYNDGRAGDQASCANSTGVETLLRLGFRMSASFGLPKILWGLQHEGDTWAGADHIVHAADFIGGRIAGSFGWSDYTNVLKSGYDVAAEAWPSYLSDLGVARSLLPNVVAPGEPVGNVCRAAASLMGLPTEAVVCAGMTDGCADQVSSGCRNPGDWNTVLGSTLVLKGISTEPVSHPSGALYSHRHPDGWWLPGGASNAGARVLETRFPGTDAARMAECSGDFLPSNVLVYPLASKGERFPFVAPEATAFTIGEPSSEEGLYAAYLQGIAFTERLSYEVVQEAGADYPHRVYTTGGGSRSSAWCRARATVLGCPLVRPTVAGAAVGAAILGMSRTFFKRLSEAQSAACGGGDVFDPEPRLLDRYGSIYGSWRAEIRARNWM